jgi:MSHA biogenesis protein MshQ
VDNAATRTPLTARLDTLLPTTGGFVVGVAAAVSAPLGIVRCTAVTCPANTNPNREDGSYAALDVGIAPVDGDGAAMAAYDLDTTNVVSTTNDHTKVARTEVRYGRIKLSNAHGSELLSLPIIATVQYWNGSYVTSATDSETQFNTNLSPAGNVQATIVKEPLALGNVSVVTPGLVTFANGVKTFTLAAPNVAGSADLAIITAPGYLLPRTTGRATFGVYKGANEFIYLRENY